MANKRTQKGQPIEVEIEETSIISIQEETIVPVDFLQQKIDAITLKDGWCVMVEVDADGNESTPTEISLKGFEQNFSNNPKFRIKKK